MHWLHHVIFEHLSVWDELKAEVILVPIFLAVWFAFWLGVSLWVARKERKRHGLGN